MTGLPSDSDPDRENETWFQNHNRRFWSQTKDLFSVRHIE